MRHGKKINHLGRKSAHRHALLSNMASSLILNKRITTTIAKAKALRKYVEPLLTRSKDDTTHSRRTVFSYLQNKESVQTLFGEVASKIADRPGGYTRIIKLADTRLGDNAEMCLIELVDFNTLYTKESAEKKGKTRRSRTKGKKSDDAAEGATDVAGDATEAKAEKKTKKAASKDEPKAEKKAPAKGKKDKK
jgi:large subunit ribosomal protein L17